MKKLIAVFLGLAMFVPAGLAFASVDLTLSGGSVTVRQGSSFVEPGYSAFSTVDGDVTSSVVSSGVSTNQPGTFLVNYSVTDSALDSAFASRSVTVSGGGGSLPYCSGPMAPGWRNGVDGGGCGGTGIVLAAGDSTIYNGAVYECLWYMGPTGCFLK